jgi:prepilin-type N-terminal cleavage/methylation domain-containing protein
MSRHPHRIQPGFTLVELLFCVGLLALLAGLAVPGLQSTLRASALRAAAFELAAGLQQTRANAILESRPALLCLVDSSGNCLASGPAAGWRAFLDTGGARRDMGGQALPSGVVLRATRSSIHFWPSSLAASAGTLTICDEHHVAAPRAIVISATGRARMSPADEGACA